MDRSRKGERGAHAMELEQTQERLRRSEELYRYVVELSNLMPWTADRNGHILAAGDRWTTWTGSTKGAALEGWQHFAHPDDVGRITREWNNAVRTLERFETEWRMRMQDGSYRWVHARAAKRMDGHDGDVAWYGTLEDIQQRRVAQDAIQRARNELARFSRLSAMGAMASGIAHDLNQPLTAIAHYVRGSKRLVEGVQGEGKEALAEALDDADKSAMRASDIVRRVRDFVTRGTVELRRENLDPLIDDACRLALAETPAPEIACHIEHKTHCTVMADRVQIQQVLVNLVQNAAEAMRDKDRRELKIEAAPGRPGFCQVSVADTGQGIAPADAQRIFEPLYTTRSGGMGVGLAICRMIVEAHGGTLWHEPAPEGGTVFLFTLPIARDDEGMT